jgi:predicted phage tail protein
MKIILHGSLRKLWSGPALEFQVMTVAEAIEAMCRQTKAFNPALGGERHRICVVGFDTVESLHAPTSVEEVHLVPAFRGDGDSWIQILVGAVLIGASFLMPASWPMLAKFTFSFGVALMMGGIISLLSDSPDSKEGSKYLGAPGNTTALGTRIPLLYGLYEAYGHFLSFNIDSDQKEILTATSTDTGGGGGSGGTGDSTDI